MKAVRKQEMDNKDVMLMLIPAHVQKEVKDGCCQLFVCVYSK